MRRKEKNRFPRRETSTFPFPFPFFFLSMINQENWTGFSINTMCCDLNHVTTYKSIYQIEMFFIFLLKKN